MWQQRWIFLLLLTLAIDSATCAGKPNFHYVGETVNFTCNFDRAVLNQPRSKFLRIVSRSGHNYFSDLCYIEYKGGQSSPIAKSVDPSVTTKACQSTLQTNKLPIKYDLRYPGNISCAVDHIYSPATVFYADHLRVCPKELTLATLPTDGIYFRQSFMAPKCTSAGGYPRSIFKYYFRERQIDSRDLKKVDIYSVYGRKQQVDCIDSTHSTGYCIVNRWAKTNISVFQSSDWHPKSKHYPDNYLNEQVVFNCPFKLLQLRRLVMGVGIQEKYPDGSSKIFLICGRYKDKFYPHPVRNRIISLEVRCSKFHPTIYLPYYLTIPWIWREGVEHSCIALTVEGPDEKGKTPVTVENPKILPTNLSIYVNGGGDIYAGEVIVINCISEGGRPAPVFEYALEEQVTNRGFIATKDHNNKSVSCWDKSHMNYKPNNLPVLKQHQKLNVYYVTATGNFESRVATKSEIVILECLIETYLPSFERFTYAWKMNGVIQSSGEANRKPISFQCLENEVWTCAVESTNKRIQVEEVVYAIRWIDLNTDQGLVIAPKPTTTNPELQTQPQGTNARENIQTTASVSETPSQLLTTNLDAISQPLSTKVVPQPTIVEWQSTVMTYAGTENIEKEMTMDVEIIEPIGQTTSNAPGKPVPKPSNERAKSSGSAMLNAQQVILFFAIILLM